MPLAILAKLPPEVSPEVGVAETVGQILERLSQEHSPAVGAKLLTASFVLSGLRVSKSIAMSLFAGVHAVQESVTYQAIVEEGEIKGARKFILRLGKKKFGRTPAAVTKALEAIEDLDRLERLSDRLLTAKNWTDLLGDE
jgi:hypothetical protein